MTLRIFINEQPCMVPDRSDVASAVSSFDPVLGGAVADGNAYVTDGVGRTLDPSTRLASGSILRVVVSARPHASNESE